MPSMDEVNYALQGKAIDILCLSETWLTDNIDNSFLIFPGYTGYEPLGIVQGEDLPLGPVFQDGFESGDAGAWSSSSGLV